MIDPRVLARPYYRPLP
ncbi:MULTISPECIES: hypothetical protein [Caulobacter]|nr:MULTISPECIES: hypothetical protein [Caulobacter]MBQ1560910.1 hypothetical protein [Caulobacter sp.]HXH47341.1 hypothetical protein [Bradyrhizobium sp.]